MAELLASWQNGVSTIVRGFDTQFGSGVAVGLGFGLVLGALFYLLRRHSLQSLFYNQARFQTEEIRSANSREKALLQQSSTDLRARLEAAEHRYREQSVSVAEHLQNQARQAEALRRLPVVESQLEQSEHKLQHAQAQALKLTEEASRAKTKLESMAQAQASLSDEFQLLADRIFKDQQKQFGQSHRSEISRLLDPLKTQLSQFKDTVDVNREKDLRERTVLKQELGQLKSLNERLSDDAQSLATALRGTSKLQGNWGELVLERVLESSGLEEGREFQREVVLKAIDGEVFRPDVVVNLPDDRYVVIDAKVSIRAYEQALQAQSEAAREAQLSLHAQAIRQHVSSLASKNYDRLNGLRSLDFVLLFIPVEGAFHAALQHAPTLYSDAFKRNVVLVSPTTLLVTLRTINNIWRYQKQSDNAEEIARRAGDLIDQFVSFSQELEAVDRHLDRAKASSDKARRKLSSGRGNMVEKAQKIKALGVASKKDLPEAQSSEAPLSPALAACEDQPSAADETQ